MAIRSDPGRCWFINVSIVGAASFCMTPRRLQWHGFFFLTAAILHPEAQASSVARGKLGRPRHRTELSRWRFPPNIAVRRTRQSSMETGEPPFAQLGNPMYGPPRRRPCRVSVCRARQPRHGIHRTSIHADISRRESCWRCQSAAPGSQHRCDTRSSETTRPVAGHPRYKPEAGAGRWRWPTCR